MKSFIHLNTSTNRGKHLQFIGERWLHFFFKKIYFSLVWLNMKVAILLRELKSNCIGSLTFNIKSLCLIESSIKLNFYISHYSCISVYFG